MYIHFALCALNVFASIFNISLAISKFYLFSFIAGKTNSALIIVSSKHNHFRAHFSQFLLFAFFEKMFFFFFIWKAFRLFEQETNWQKGNFIKFYIVCQQLPFQEVLHALSSVGVQRNIKIIMCTEQQNQILGSITCVFWPLLLLRCCPVAQSFYQSLLVL